MDWRAAATRRYARLVTDAVTRRPELWRLLGRPLAWRFEQLAPHWDRIRRPGGLAPLAAALAEVAPPRRALDLGTGTGDGAVLVAQTFPEAEVVGVDVAAGMVAEARRKLPPELAARVRFERADAARLPFRDGEFELVTLVNMIPFWGELARVVAPGGVVVCCYGSGAATPIYVPEERLRAGLGRRGFAEFAAFAAGRGIALLARRQAAR